MRPVTPTQAVLAGILFVVALVCGYGALASLEPGAGHGVFLAVYLIVVVASLAGACWMLWGRR